MRIALKLKRILLLVSIATLISCNTIMLQKEANKEGKEMESNRMQETDDGNKIGEQGRLDEKEQERIVKREKKEQKDRERKERREKRSKKKKKNQQVQEEILSDIPVNNINKIDTPKFYNQDVQHFVNTYDDLLNEYLQAASENNTKKTDSLNAEVKDIISKVSVMSKKIRKQDEFNKYTNYMNKMTERLKAIN